MRTRFFDRLCGRRRQPPGEGAPVKIKFPDTPLILAGALGGPFVIFFLTPLRNALTLASQDAKSSAWDLYSHTFAEGFTGGWTGGHVAVPASCPQFVVMGPFFHLMKESTGNPVIATMASAAAETLISFGSQTLNAQMAQAELGGDLAVPMWNPLVPLGPGATVHVIRNTVALSGIRVFSSPCQAGIAKLGFVPAGAVALAGDFMASIGAAILSAPLNQCHNFAVCSYDYLTGSPMERVHVLLNFLDGNYLRYDEDGKLVGLTATLPRDLFMRCAYVATLFAMFGSIERVFVSFWKYRRPADSS